MMKQILFGGQPNDPLNNAATEYSSVSGGTTWNATETARTQCISAPGTIDSLYVELTADPGTAPDAYRFTLRKNGADTTLTCTITANDVAGSDVAHSVAVVAGDVICIQAEALNTPSATPGAQWTMRFTGTNAGESLVLGHTSCSTAETRYSGIHTGNSANSATEGEVRQVCPTAGTLKNLYISLSIDPGTSPDAYTYTLRKNGADTTLTCTIVADNTTGNDTAHTVAVVAGDVLTMSIAPVSTPSGQPRAAFGFTFAPTIDGESILMGGSTDDLNNAATEYIKLGGGAGSGIVWDATETNVQSLGQVCVLRKLYVLLSAAPNTGNTYTFTPRVNAGSPADGLSVAITGTATTGNDTTHAIHLTAGDNVALMVVPASTPDVADAYWGLVCYTGVIADAASAIAAATSVSALSTQVVSSMAAINAVADLVILGDGILSGVVPAAAAASVTADGDMIGGGKADISTIVEALAQALRLRQGAGDIQAVASLATVGNLLVRAWADLGIAASVSADGDGVFAGVVDANVAAILAANPGLFNLILGECDLGIITSASIDGGGIFAGAISAEAVAALIAMSTRVQPSASAITIAVALEILGDMLGSGVAALGITASVTSDGDLTASGQVASNVAAALVILASRIRSGGLAIDATVSVAALQAAVRSALWAANVAASVTTDGDAVRGGASGIEAGVGVGLDADALMGAIAALAASAGIVPNGDAVFSGAVAANVAAVLGIIASEINLVRAWAALGIAVSVTPDGDRVASGESGIGVDASLGAFATQVLLSAALIDVAAGLLLDGDNVAGGESAFVVAASLVAGASRIRFALAALIGSISLSLSPDISSLYVFASIVAAASVAGVARKVNGGTCEVTISGALAVAAWKLALEDLFAFTGAFVTGKVIVIDMDAKTVTVDGVNALHQTNSTFFKFAEGVNQVIYEDDEAARTVAASIVHKNRWV